MKFVEETKKRKMFASKSTLSVCLLVCFLSCSVSEDPQEHLITARPGDDVTLPCKAPNNVTIAAVEWIRSDLQRLVFLKRDGHLVTAEQDPSYVNRVQLKDDEMKNGELSLILKKVTNNDGGRYECRYKGERGDDQIKFISVVIRDAEGETSGNSQTGGETEEGKKDRNHGLKVGLSVTVGILLLVVVGFVFYKIHEGRSNQPDHYTATNTQPDCGLSDELNS